MTYGTMQVAALAIYGAIALVLALVFVVVARSSREDVPFERVQGPGYWLRKRWLALLAALAPLVIGISALSAPYARGSDDERTVVEVTSAQYFFALDPPEVPAGSDVRFRVTSQDVNHGFGLYDPSGRLMGSVQAMPGYRNELDLTFDEPGTYLILCFELCGLDHHRMQGTFTVTEPAR